MLRRWSVAQGVATRKDRDGQVFEFEGRWAPAGWFGAGVGSAERRVQQHTAGRVRRSTTQQQQQGGRWLTMARSATTIGWLKGGQVANEKR